MYPVVIMTLALSIMWTPVFAESQHKTLQVPITASPETLGYELGRTDELSWGPSQVVPLGDNWIVADPVHSRIVTLDERGTVLKTQPTPFPPAEIWVSQEGTLWAMDGSRERVVTLDKEAGETPVFLPSRSIGLATGPSGDLWVLLADGHSVPLMGKAGIRRATPMGKGHLWHATGQKVSEKKGRILMWAWNRPADVKGQGPSRVIEWNTQEKLGSIRPLGMDTQGNLFVRVETLAPGKVIRVREHLYRIDRNGKRFQLSWPVSSINPHLDGLHLSETGSLVRFAVLPNSLVLTTYGTDEWNEVVP